MKLLLRDFMWAFVMGFLLPALLMGLTVCALDTRSPSDSVPVEETVPQIRSGYRMRLKEGDTVTEQDLDNYLVGVLLAEMPADFPEEALKAQAVAARTYTRKAWQTGGKHGDGSVCTEPVCCQSWISPEEFLERGGTGQALMKITQAVRSTAGQVLVFEGELIEATYFSASGGKTEAAVAVWGTDFPYLQSVESPGEEDSGHHREMKVFTPEEFSALLGLSLRGAPEDWFDLAQYTEGGTLSRVRIGERDFTGAEIRSALGLRSAAISIDVTAGEIRVTTLGYGHRVGMSQYGARAMADRGSDHIGILSHYYPGTEVVILKADTPLPEPGI